MRIIDGDTVEQGGTRYRLAGIDAPENGQVALDGRGRRFDAGAAATGALSNYLADMQARHWQADIVWHRGDIDRYRRQLAHIELTHRDGRHPRRVRLDGRRRLGRGRVRHAVPSPRDRRPQKPPRAVGRRFRPTEGLAPRPTWPAGPGPGEVELAVVAGAPADGRAEGVAGGRADDGAHVTSEHGLQTPPAQVLVKTGRRRGRV